MDGEFTADRPVVSVRRVYGYPRDAVFRAWTDPTSIGQWFGPKGYRAEVQECDLRVGGRWKFLMIGQGGTSVVHQGTYVEIAPHDRLVFTWASVSRPEGWLDAETVETLVTVELLDLGRSTEVILTHEGLISDLARNSLTGGWGGGLECLDEFLLQSLRPAEDGHVGDVS